MTIDQSTLINQVDAIVRETGTGRRAVIPILHKIQKVFFYLPEDALRRVCDTTDISPADITGVSTFYSQFRHSPVGEHLIHVCTGTACHVKGAERVYDAFFRELQIKKGSDTDPDGRFTVEKVACLGCCTLAPVVQIDDITFGHVKPDKVHNVLQDFLLQADTPSAKSGGAGFIQEAPGEIRIGLGSCCIAGGSAKVQAALESSLSDMGIRPRVKRVGCVGMCHRTPLLEIELPGQDPVMYDQVQAEDVSQIVQNHFVPENRIKRLKTFLFRTAEAQLSSPEIKTSKSMAQPIRDPHIRAFLSPQHHIVTEYCGEIDPLDLEEYHNKGGFIGLKKVLSMSPSEVIDQIKESGLRGRGGAGFPTGKKWEITRDSNDSKTYLICNGDEGDPGAFMDRMILESYPFRVIEGMIIAAFAVGAHEGFFYIRAEYPLAVQRVGAALETCRQEGILGENILDSGFSLDLQIMEGAGAFVCGEETALIASIEGKRGMPVFRPPYPAEKGLWGRSTLVNNCETLATVPWIMRNGAGSFKELGSEKSKGTKVFSLAGKISRGGLIEVPMGITIREIVEQIGGGIEGGRSFKAVQIGGPSGGCVPADQAFIKIDYEDLTQVGAMMGSGGLLVMDESDCMVDIARYFLSFTYDQSCGKCTFCRIGTRHMLEILEKICAGKGSQKDIVQLEEIAEKTRERSLCALGGTAPNPVLTTLRYFRDEYEAHLNGHCPAKKCQDLIQYKITDRCIGCTVCAQNCPTGAIPIRPYKRHRIVQEDCSKCDACFQACPNGAIEIVS